MGDLKVLLLFVQMFKSNFAEGGRGAKYKAGTSDIKGLMWNSWKETLVIGHVWDSYMYLPGSSWPGA